MAFKTLDEFRTATEVGLNDELGLLSDADNSWGSSAQRNGFIRKAIAKLWPSVALLTRETFTTVTNQQDYTLTTLVDIERLEVMDPASPTIVTDRVRSWQLYEDETGDPPVKRLLIPAMSAGITVRAIGYKRYLIPTTGSTTTDIPPYLEWLVVTGARVEAYRRKANQFANFERFQSENRTNALSPADVLELLRDAKRDWERGMGENGRALSGARRARLETG